MPKSNITLKPKAQVITYVMCLNLFKTAKKHKKASYGDNNGRQESGGIKHDHHFISADIGASHLLYENDKNDEKHH